MTGSPVVSIQQINEGLADRLEDLLPELIGGEARKGEWVAASTRDGGVGDSLSVVLRGSKRGQWYHHAAGVGGDPLGLVNYMRFNNSDMKQAFAWSRDFLGGKIAPETENERELRLRRFQALKRKEEREERTRRGKARYHFLVDPKTVVDWKGTPAWHYMDNRLRGQFARLGHVPGCIRFHPELYNSQLGLPLPGMIAAVVDAEGDQIALHRTWLVKRGAGDDRWDRLREEDLADYGGKTSDDKDLVGKKVLGSFRGGTIRLWAGQQVNTETGEVRRGPSWRHLPAGSTIMESEGIETGFSLALAMPERRIVSVISIEGFADAVLPPCFSNVVIAGENDPENKAAARAIERAQQAHASAGRNCKVVYPPEGIDDWCTALTRVA